MNLERPNIVSSGAMLYVSELIQCFPYFPCVSATHREVELYELTALTYVHLYGKMKNGYIYFLHHGVDCTLNCEFLFTFPLRYCMQFICFVDRFINRISAEWFENKVYLNCSYKFGEFFLLLLSWIYIIIIICENHLTAR